MFSSQSDNRAAGMRVYQREFVAGQAANLHGLDAHAQRVSARSGGKLATSIADRMTGVNKYSPLQR